MQAPKPHLSCAGCGKDRAGGVAGSEMGGKKNRSSGRGSAGASNIVAVSV